MNRERMLWIVIVSLLVGIIILEFVFLGGLAALLELLEEVADATRDLIEEIIGGLS